MFDWLKRLLSDPPAASLPGDIANPPPEVPESTKDECIDECIDEARRLVQEAVDMLDDHGLPFEDIEGIVGDAVGDYWEEIYGEDEDDSWFPGKEYDDDDDCDDDGCDCSIDCECPGCSDADDDYI